MVKKKKGSWDEKWSKGLTWPILKQNGQRQNMGGTFKFPYVNGRSNDNAGNTDTN